MADIGNVLVPTAYRIANSFDSHRQGLPDEYQDWAAEISRNLRQLAATQVAPDGMALVPRPMESAPRDGTLLRLLVAFTNHAIEDSADPVWTIGSNSFDNHGDEDKWKFAGWSWEQDCYTQGEGTPVGWLPWDTAASDSLGANNDDIAVDMFAAAMKKKLAAARAKGRGGWDDREDLEQHLSNLLRAHVDKGDPIDVANFCCFLWNRCEAICAAPAAAVAEVKKNQCAKHGSIAHRLYCEIACTGDPACFFGLDAATQARWADGVESVIGKVAASAAQVAVSDPLLLGLEQSLSEIDPEEARWQTCSGCYETEDGHPVGEYPYSPLLGIPLGGGCSECGGLGAVWDMTNYADFVEYIPDEATATPAVVIDEAMKRRAAEAIANARAGRRGAPAITNVLDILPPNLLSEVMEDAEDALAAALKVSP